MASRLRDWMVVVLLASLVAMILVVTVDLHRLAAKLSSSADAVSLVSMQAQDFLLHTEERTNPMLTHMDEAAGRFAHTMEKVQQVARQVADDQGKVTDGTMQVLQQTSGVLEETRVTLAGISRDSSDIRIQTVADLKTLNDGLFEAKDLIADTDKLVTDPTFLNTMSNVDHLTYNLSLMSKDSQAKFHDWLYPQPYSGRFRTLHRVWTLGKGVLQFSEPAYYLTNLK